MPFTLNSPSGEQNILDVLQNLMTQIILAAQEGRSVMISGVIQGREQPLDVSLVFGLNPGLSSIRELFIRSNTNVLNFAAGAPVLEQAKTPEAKKGVEAKIEKQEDGKIIINFNK